MKTKHTIMVVLAMICNLITAQNTPQCLGVLQQNQNQTQATGPQCYKNNDGEIKTFQVTANSPTITFNVSFHFIFHPSQATAFSAVSQAQLLLDVGSTVADINLMFKNAGNIPQMNIVPNPSPLVPDSKIRIQNAGVYFHTNALAVGGTTAIPWPTLFPQGFQNSINIYFYEDVQGSFAYYHTSGKFIGASLDPHTAGTSIRPELLCHELGHALGGLADHYYAIHSGTWANANIYASPFPNYLPDDAMVDKITGSCNSTASDAQNNIMGGTNCRQHLSARQIASFHHLVARGITSFMTTNFNSTPYSPHPENNSAEILNLTTTQTFSNSFVFDKLIIKSGVTVTFTNCVLYAKTENSKIFVEKGATLRMYCCKVTPRKKNDTQWQGIEVDGTYNFKQSSTPWQGVLEMFDCKIEKALTGVLVGKTIYPGYNAPFSGGGWAILNGCEFINCLTGFEMLPVSGVNNPDNNLTTLINCNFVATAEYLISMGTPQFIGAKLDEVRGVALYGCTFNPYLDIVTTAWPSSLNVNKHYGVKAHNSRISIEPSITVAPFFGRRLDYGVHATGYGSMVIEDGYFEARNAVFLEGLNYAKVVRNYIETNRTPPLNTTSYPYDKNTGIYLSGFNTYKIEKNEIGCLSFPTFSIFCEGIVVDHSGPFGSLIYNNKLYRMKLGIWCQDQNYDPNTNIGLQINCNDIDACEYSIGVQTEDPVTGQFTGIQQAQGISFSFLDKNVRNTYANTSYRYWNDNIPYVYPPIVTHGSFVDPLFRVGPQPQFSSPTHITDLHSNVLAPSDRNQYCPGMDANKPKVFFTGQIAQLSEILKNFNNSYTSLLDGGNTTTLVALVNTSAPNENLKNILLNKSFLSDEVLLAYFAKTSLPPGHLLQVFQVNAPASQEIYNFAIEKGLPHGIENQITLAQNQAFLSPRSQKEAEIDITKNNLDYAITSKIGALFEEDSIPNLRDSINALIVTRDEGNILKQQIDLDIAFANYTAANDKLSILSQGDGTGIIPEQDQKYILFKQLYISIITSDSGSYIIKSDLEKAEALYNVANDLTNPCIKEAQGLIGAVYHTYFPEEKLIPGNTGQRMTNSVEEAEVIKLANGLALYPNPTANEFFVSNSSDKAYQLKIINISGQLIQSGEITRRTVSRVNTSDLINGIYFVNLYEGSTLIKTSKLAIVK